MGGCVWPMWCTLGLVWVVGVGVHAPPPTHPNWQLFSVKYSYFSAHFGVVLCVFGCWSGMGGCMWPMWCALGLVWVVGVCVRAPSPTHTHWQLFSVKYSYFSAHLGVFFGGVRGVMACV